MTLTIRRLIISALGLIAGLTAWPAMELMVSLQERFPSILLFTAVSGAVFGLLFGAIFSTAEGIISAVPRRIYVAALVGAGVGVAGGAAGLLVGQGALFLAGELMFSAGRDVGPAIQPLTRAIGWSVLGLSIGAAEGIRARSGLKIAVGVAGGFVGGLLGGAALEYVRILLPSTSFARLAGLLIFGIALAAAYAIAEKRLSHGTLRVLNGKNKGREVILNQRRIVIGASPRSDVVLNDYLDIAERHARITVDRRDLFIEPSGKGALVKVNDILVSRVMLKNEDVIQVGSAKLIYRPI